MAVRYFCDNCGAETRGGDLKILVVSVPPQSETFDVCPQCARKLTAELERCRKVKRERELARPERSQSGALAAFERYGSAALQLPGVTRVGRGLSYVGVFLLFFVAVTLLASLR
jgi:predicted RNA-binding Zn-ribbon protein involved in translation (DUF1610 family)